MAFNASVNLGTVGNGITGQTVSISGCTGSSCGSGCTSLATSQAVSSFPKTLSGIPDGTVSLFVKVDGGDCSGTNQCISVTGLPGATPTPTSTGTATPTSTIGATPTPTGTSTSTPTGTSTPTITPTLTATPTSTVQLPGCSSTVTGEYSGSGLYNYPDNQLDFTGVPNGSTINFTCTANDRPNNISIRTALTVLESTGWFGNSSGYDSQDYWYPTEGTGPITLSITYDNTKTYYIDALTAPALAAPNEVNDYWEVSIQCLGVPTLTPTVTPTTVYVYYRAGEVMDSSLSTTYCNGIGSGGQGYLINSPFYTTDTMLTAGVTTIYSDSNLQNTVQGSWSLGNVTRMAYITEFENQQAQNTPTTTNPNGDLLYDGGTYKFMRVDSNGLIISIGTDSCTGGPGGPAEA